MCQTIKKQEKCLNIILELLLFKIYIIYHIIQYILDTTIYNFTIQQFNDNKNLNFFQMQPVASK